MADSGLPDHEPPSSPALPEAKRRKLRKGTRSCWECKRRKNKCTWSCGKGKCDGCHHRDTPCRSQELPEDHASQARRGTKKSDDNNLRRLEALVEKLARKVHPGDVHEHHTPSISDDKGGETPVASTTASPRPDAVALSPVATSPSSSISNNNIWVSLLCQLRRIHMLKYLGLDRTTAGREWRRASCSHLSQDYCLPVLRWANSERPRTRL